LSCLFAQQGEGDPSAYLSAPRSAMEAMARRFDRRNALSVICSPCEKVRLRSSPRSPLEPSVPSKLTATLPFTVSAPPLRRTDCRLRPASSCTSLKSKARPRLSSLAEIPRSTLPELMSTSSTKQLVALRWAVPLAERAQLKESASPPLTA